MSFLLVIIAVTAAAAMAAILSIKIETVKRLQINLNRLKRSLDEMDEQAKLIVRTDMELNKVQQELDKRTASLATLQKLSRSISGVLEVKAIFKGIKASYLQEFGFDKSCAYLWNEREGNFLEVLSIGYTEEEAGAITQYINSKKHGYWDWLLRERPFSSISKQENKFLKAEEIESVFKTSSFIISPILPAEGSKGILFVGTANPEVAITEGDEELITVLANQISQSLENARLFEKAWTTQQSLEKNVEERTHELTVALNEVRKVSKRKTDFISSVSHELRTPLTSVKGYASILLEEKLGKLPTAAKERLEKINHHSDELVHMVNDLLDIARIESGKTVMKIEGQNLNEIIATVSDLIMIQCKNKNIELKTDIQKNLPQVMADRNQLERVFINLLGNAVKFTPEKGKISLKAKGNDEAVEVAIADSGIGMPPDALTHLFEEFYRVDNAVNQQVKGTGLGLSLVKHIVEAHKGKIWVESAVGRGSTFYFTLPIKQ
ncbi:MAG: GAF domain-containing sensor histidine kinase [Candidatus Omnitrophota bacterium]